MVLSMRTDEHEFQMQAAPSAFNIRTYPEITTCRQHPPAEIACITVGT